jgi:hypothetical protein
VSVLAPEERALLLEAVHTHRPDPRPLVDDLMTGERRLSGVEGNALREAVGDDLARTGLHASRRPSAVTRDPRLLVWMWAEGTLLECSSTAESWRLFDSDERTVDDLRVTDDDPRRCVF